MRTVFALGLFVAAAGVLTEYFVLPGFPPVPPGPIILAVAGVVVLALARYRWSLFVGLFAALFLTVGGLIEGSVWGHLGDPGRFDAWIGVFLQWTGQLVALIAGVIALRQAYARRATPALR